MISYDKMFERTRSSIALVTTAWIPRRPWIGVVSGGAFWYGRRVALTYAPGILADYFIKLTITFVGSETAGKVVGMTVVAPMFTPSVTPLAAMATGGILFYAVSLICNLAVQCFARFEKAKVV